MMIKIDDATPLFEQVFDVLRVYMYLNDAADYSRMGLKRSRSYISCLRYNGHEPSPDAYVNLLEYLNQCLAETQDTDQREVLTYYIAKVGEAAQ